MENNRVPRFYTSLIRLSSTEQTRAVTTVLFGFFSALFLCFLHTDTSLLILSITLYYTLLILSFLCLLLVLSKYVFQCVFLSFWISLMFFDSSTKKNMHYFAMFFFLPLFFFLVISSKSYSSFSRQNTTASP